MSFFYYWKPASSQHLIDTPFVRHLKSTLKWFLIYYYCLFRIPFFSFPFFNSTLLLYEHKVFINFLIVFSLACFGELYDARHSFSSQIPAAKNHFAKRRAITQNIKTKTAKFQWIICGFLCVCIVGLEGVG